MPSKSVAGRILARIEEAGFTVRAMRMIRMSKREAEGFYDVHVSARSSAGSPTSCRLGRAS